MNDHDILPDNSPPHTSPLNGVAERFLRTIEDCSRALLTDSGLPKRLWPQAITYAIHLHNCLPKAACNDQIPHTMVYKRLPPLKFLKRFGCVVHQTLPKKVGKFSDKSLRKFFVGLTSNSSLLLDVSTGHITPASNVIFTESQVYGHHYGPFEATPFRDPIKLKRKAKETFGFQHDIQLNLKPIKRSRLSVDFSSDDALNSYLASTIETSFFLQKKTLPSSTVQSLPYPTDLLSIPSLQNTHPAYAPFRVDDSQPLPENSKQHFALTCRHYLLASLDSHVRGESYFDSTDSLSSSC